MKIIWEVAIGAKHQKVIQDISTRFNPERGQRAVVCFKLRFKLWIYPRTQEPLPLSAIMELSTYGTQLAKTRGIFSRIARSRNLEPILPAVIVCMQKYHRIVDIFARQDRMDRQSFSIPLHGNLRTIYRHTQSGCGMVSSKRNVQQP